MKAIKDLMILDLVMHTRLPEQGKLLKRGNVCDALLLYFYRVDDGKRKELKSRMSLEVLLINVALPRQEINFSLGVKYASIFLG